MPHYGFIICRVGTLIGIDKHHVDRYITATHYTVYHFAGIAYMQMYVGAARRLIEKLSQFIGMLRIYLHGIDGASLWHSLSKT